MAQDFTTLNNPKFLYSAEMHHPFPDWVAAEPIPSAEEFEKKAGTAFADPVRRLLPICTKSAAFHSMLNILATPDEFDERAAEKVKEACSHYGIEGDILPYVDFFLDDFEKSAGLATLSEGRYAINDSIDGEKLELLPLNDAEDVNSSASDLVKMAGERRIPLVLLVPAAREIVKAAVDHDVDGLPQLVVRFGEARYPDEEQARKLIQGRELNCREESLHEKIAADYQEALDDLEKDPDGAMEKIATIDMLAGIEPSFHPAAAVPTAYDIVFCGPLVKEAEQAATTQVIVRDVMLPLDALKNIDLTDADFRLSKEAAVTFRNMLEAGDGRDMSLAVEEWNEVDQKTLLRLAVAANPD